MTPYILIIFLASSPHSNSGGAGISQEFSSHATCKAAGNALAADAAARALRHPVLWGCFKK